MKPKDILPDDVNSIDKDGIVVRKGTLGAFSENIRIIESTIEGSAAYSEAVADLLDLVPALLKLNFFDFYRIKSEKVRDIIFKNFPTLPID